MLIRRQLQQWKKARDEQMPCKTVTVCLRGCFTNTFAYPASCLRSPPCLLRFSQIPSTPKWSGKRNTKLTASGYAQFMAHWVESVKRAINQEALNWMTARAHDTLGCFISFCACRHTLFSFLFCILSAFHPRPRWDKSGDDRWPLIRFGIDGRAVMKVSQV